MSSPTIIFAGGGSGGHISPGLAIAERLAEVSPQSRSIFLCSNRAIDTTMLTDAGVEFVPLPAAPPSLKPAAFIRFCLNFQRSQRLAKRIMRQRQVDRVVTLGGFVAAPVVAAARARRIPILLVNLDSPPGRANLWMAKKADEVVSAVALPSLPHFASRVVGMPIRQRTLAPADASECRLRLRLDPSKKTLLITGASQGATSLNHFVPALAVENPGLFAGWQIYHLAGHGSEGEVRRAYEKADVNAKVEPFLNDMGLAWGAADLALSRAGASSVAEAAHNAVPTLFLPYPYHADMHQKFNAQPLVDMGGAAMAIDQIEVAQNVAGVGPVLRELMANDAKRQAMRNALRAHSFPDAAKTIAEMLV